MSRATLGWIVLGWVGFALLPWYGFERSAAPTLADYFVSGSALVHGFRGAWWLLPIARAARAWPWLPVVRPTADAKGTLARRSGRSRPRLIVAQGFAIGLNGWTLDILHALFGEPGPRQAGMGYGAALTATAFLILLCHGLPARGWCRGDAFVVSSIGAVVALIVVFVFFPVSTILASAFAATTAALRAGGVRRQIRRHARSGVSTACSGDLRCGVAWNTLFLGLLVGFGTTALGLAFALIATRTEFRFKKLLRVMSVLPIITPPFVIGLALILLFGRSGACPPCCGNGSASRARAGSTGFPACSSPSSSPSRRSPSSSSSASCRASARPWRKPRRPCAPRAGRRSGP